MTHNDRSKIISFRLDHDALSVLEWEAARTGVPVRTRIRAWAEARAEEISNQYRGLAYERSATPLGDSGELPVSDIPTP
ncbi:MAG: hypothetical protein ACOYOQ_00240 [Microthrixaceae bacterium]